MMNSFLQHSQIGRRKSRGMLDAMAVPSMDVRISIEEEMSDLFFCGMTTTFKKILATPNTFFGEGS
jgi:hypothetical protein